MPIAILGLISGESVIQSVIWLIVLGVVFWLLNWLIGYCSIPAPFAQVARVILAIAAVICIINVLLGIAGHPIFRF